jgi:hypothetical protein
MPSRFAGIRNAIDYAYGYPGCAAGPLQVIQGSTTSGAYTIVCSPVQSQSIGGDAITITVNNPITIGSDSGIETVTPTAVSLNNLGQVLITATFANAHSTGAQVRSGSFGLGEAVQSAHQFGGLVIVDGAWVAAGGVNATITATKGWTNVSILDGRGTASASAFSYHSTGTSSPAVYAASAVSWY